MVEVVAEAAAGQATIREAVLDRPDVVIMDLPMPTSTASSHPNSPRPSSTTALVLITFDEDSCLRP